jgi:hypothetical protein
MHPKTAMTTYTHDTVPTEFVEAGGIRFAYRRFGDRGTGHAPVVFFQHFVGNLDDHDPAISDGFAGKGRCWSAQRVLPCSPARSRTESRDGGGEDVALAGAVNEVGLRRRAFRDKAKSSTPAVPSAKRGGRRWVS